MARWVLRSVMSSECTSSWGEEATKNEHLQKDHFVLRVPGGAGGSVDLDSLCSHCSSPSTVCSCCGLAPALPKTHKQGEYQTRVAGSSLSPFQPLVGFFQLVPRVVRGSRRIAVCWDEDAGLDLPDV